MDFQRSETSPETIPRLSDVLRRTGLTRSTIYDRIAKKEFPHQVSLGGRAVGWLEREVEDWINERVHLRPGSMAGISDPVSEAANPIPRDVQSERRRAQRSTASASRRVSVNDSSPDPARLHLVDTKLYFDRSTGAFWIKLLAENSASRR